jgi:hypothetical protein
MGFTPFYPSYDSGNKKAGEGNPPPAFPFGRDFFAAYLNVNIPRSQTAGAS